MAKEREISKKDRVEILLEDMRHEFKAVGEGVSMAIEKIEQVDRKVDATKKELEDMMMFNSKALHARIDKVEQKIDAAKVELKQDIQKLDKKIDKIDEKLTIRQNTIEKKIDNLVQEHLH